jgi:hypothetical protein
MNVKLIIFSSIIICTIIYIIYKLYKENKENYPSIGDVKNFSNINHQDETTLTSEQIIDRYGIAPFIPIGNNQFNFGNFNNRFANFLYLLIGIQYIKLYYWRTLCNDIMNYKVWTIGPMEFLVDPEGRYNEMLKIIKNYKNCMENADENSRNTCETDFNLRFGTDLDWRTNREDRQTITEIINTLEFLKSPDKLNNRLNRITPPYTGTGTTRRDIENNRKIKEKFGQYVLQNYTNEELMNNALISSRTSPFVYKKNIDINSINFKDSKFKFISGGNQDINIPLINWVRNFGICTDTSNVDWGQNVVREAGSVYRYGNSNTYFLCFRGIVYTDEMSICTNAEPISISRNYKVHSGFYKCFINKPKYNKDVKNMPYFININGNNEKDGYIRDFYEEYERKGSLKEQMIDFLKNTNIQNLIICGHSMGAGIAQIVLSDILLNNRLDNNKICCYLLNSPRTINIDLMRYITKKLDGKIYDVQNVDDMLSSLPPSHFEPVEKILKTLDENGNEINVRYQDKGFTYCHFDNIIGYCYNRNNVIYNHFLEGANYGIERLYDMIYSPTTDITNDIIYNGIYQKLLDTKKIPKKIENNRGCFLGTSNPAYWIRGFKNDDSKTPYLFQDIYPERLEMLANNGEQKTAFYLMRSIQLLILDFIKIRATSEFQNIEKMRNIVYDVENMIKTDTFSSNPLIYNDRKHKIWTYLYDLFSQILSFFQQGKKITYDNLEELDLQNINQLKEDLTYRFSINQPTRYSPNNIVTYTTLKAITRTMFLFLCPPNLRKRNHIDYAYKSILCLLNILGYTAGINISQYIEGENFLRQTTYLTGTFYVAINSYFSKLGVYYDNLNDGLISNYRKTNKDYDNIDWRTWEMLYGFVGKVDKNILQNMIQQEYNSYDPPLMNLENIPIDGQMTTKYGILKQGGVKNVISFNCQEENKCNNLLEYTKLTCISNDKMTLPIPGYDTDNLQNNCNGADLLSRNGRNLTDTFNSYDPTLSQSFLKYFHENSIAGTHLKTVSLNSGVVFKFFKLNTENQPKNVYMISFDGREHDSQIANGRTMFDKVVQDLVYAIKTQNFGDISDAIQNIYNQIITVSRWALPIAGTASLLGTIFFSGGLFATSGILLIATLAIGIILTLAETSGGNETEKTRKILKMLPYSLIKFIIDKKLEELQPTINQSINSEIGIGYTSDLIKEIIQNYIDVLLGPEFSLLSSSIPDSVSFKAYTAALNGNKFLGLSENNYETWNIYNKPVNIYYNLRQNVLESLNNIDNNKDFHIYITGFGMGGGVAHCMFLDSILNDFSVKSNKNNLNKSINFEKMTFYSYGSPRVFNTTILNTIAKKSKPVLYNILNADDWLINYPSALFNGITGPSIPISSNIANNLDRNLYSTYYNQYNEMVIDLSARYNFSHYPTSLIFNNNYGLESKQGGDFYNLDKTSREKYNYVERNHSIISYMSGLTDLNRKIIGGWFGKYISSSIGNIITINLPIGNINKYKQTKQDKFNLPPTPTPSGKPQDKKLVYDKTPVKDIKEITKTSREKEEKERLKGPVIVSNNKFKNPKFPEGTRAPDPLFVNILNIRENWTQNPVYGFDYFENNVYITSSNKIYNYLYNSNNIIGDFQKVLEYSDGSCFGRLCASKVTYNSENFDFIVSPQNEICNNIRNVRLIGCPNKIINNYDIFNAFEVRPIIENVIVNDNRLCVGYDSTNNLYIYPLFTNPNSNSTSTLRLIKFRYDKPNNGMSSINLTTLKYISLEDELSIKSIKTVNNLIIIYTNDNRLYFYYKRFIGDDSSERYSNNKNSGILEKYLIDNVKNYIQLSLYNNFIDIVVNYTDSYENFYIYGIKQENSVIKLYKSSIAKLLRNQ